MENVDGFEITWDAEYIHLKFTDLFGDGEQYSFTTGEMVRVRDGISRAIRAQRRAVLERLRDGPGSAVS